VEKWLKYALFILLKTDYIIVSVDRHKLYFGVMPDKIEMFLDDCLDLIDENLRSLITSVAQGATD
ncbi:hypothetical protein, partial [Helicobacter magdeburgensis]|uniref:hypothetical protein n=1 Tax=Helicobacter magdeburgensis TaxID=471858 RepID=UPI001F249524